MSSTDWKTELWMMLKTATVSTMDVRPESLNSTVVLGKQNKKLL